VYPLLLFVGGHNRAWAPLGPIPAVANAMAARRGGWLLNVMLGGISFSVLRVVE